MKPAGIIRKALLLIVSVVFAIAIERIFWDVSEGDFPLAEAAVFAVLLSLLSLLFCRQRITEEPDAPPHQHTWRLCYAGWEERLVVVCETCRKSCRLARRINAITFLYIMLLTILLYIPLNFLLHCRLVLAMLLCYKVAELLVNRLRYLALRRCDPLSLLSETDRIRLMAETTAEEA